MSSLTHENYNTWCSANWNAAFLWIYHAYQLKLLENWLTIIHIVETKFTNLCIYFSSQFQPMHCLLHFLLFYDFNTFSRGHGHEYPSIALEAIHKLHLQTDDEKCSSVTLLYH